MARPRLELALSGSATSPFQSPTPAPDLGDSQCSTDSSKYALCASASAWLNHSHRLGGEHSQRLLLLGRLDSGAFSKVYKALDVETLEILALKEVAVTDLKSRDMVRHEVAALELQRVSRDHGPHSLDLPSPGAAAAAAAAAAASARAAAFGSSSSADLIDTNGEFDGFADDSSSLESGGSGGSGSRSEADSGSGISPYIVKFYGCTVKQGAPARGMRRGSSSICTLAIEYVPGGNLQSWVDAGLPWSEPWIAQLATHALSALKYLNAHRRLHRDIKPANLLLTRSGGSKLADFGLSIPSRSEDQGGMRDTMVGTKAYMAPERLRAERYNHKSDIFSLGLALASVVLGSSWRKAESEFEQLALSETAAAVVAARCAAANVSPPLTGLLGAMLHADLTLRPGAAELLQTDPFLRATAPFPSTPACQKVVRALEERSRHAQKAFDVAEVLKKLAAARLDRYHVGLGASAAAGLPALAEDLGLTRAELLERLESATSAELTARLGANLAGRLMRGGNGRNTLGCTAAASEEQLHGLLLEMSVGAPEDGLHIAGSAQSSTPSLWGSDGETECCMACAVGTQVHSCCYGGPRGQKEPNGNDSNGLRNSWGCRDGFKHDGEENEDAEAAHSAVACANGQDERLAPCLSPVQTRRSLDGRLSGGNRAAKSLRATTGHSVERPRALSHQGLGCGEGGHAGEPGLWLEALEHDLRKEREALRETGAAAASALAARQLGQRPHTAGR